MDSINLIGIKAFGYHGVLKDERTHGQDFLVDAILHLDLKTASEGDDLAATVNYADAVDVIVEEVRGEPVDLIERLAERIAKRLKGDFPLINQVTVTVHKPHAPVDAEFKDISVTITR
jgi:dihydroneopterin aldolase